MDKGLWGACLDCDDNCCRLEVSKKIFITKKEKLHLSEINKSFPCEYLDRGGLCKVHKKRPFDCRFFPFDIMESAGKFMWIIWEVKCPIAKEEKNYEQYLVDYEKHLIPYFIDFMMEYSKFREEEMDSRYKYKILREVEIKTLRKNI